MAGNNEAGVPSSRVNRQRSQEEIGNASRKSQLTALQGATLAFNNNAKPPKPAVPPPRGGARSPRRPETPKNVGNGGVSPESSPDRHIGSVRDTIMKFTDNNGSTSDTLRVPRDNATRRKNSQESPQWIAAQLATERSATNSPSPARPSPGERSNELEGSKGRMQDASTQLDRKGSNASLKGIKPKKPVLPVSRGNGVVGRAGSIRDPVSSPGAHSLDKSGPVSSQAPPRFHPVNEPAKLTHEELLTPSKTTTLSPGDPSKPSPPRLGAMAARKDERILSEKPTANQILTPSPKRYTQQPPDIERKPPLPSRTNTSNSNTTHSSNSIPSGKATDNKVTRSATSRSPPRSGMLTESTLSRLRSQNHSSTSLKPQNTGMSDDSMANAIAASSIASSRAPSPSRNQPPPPPPKRGTRSRTLLHPHSSRTDDSRTPSPAKGLRETMRTHPKSDDEEDHSKKHSRRRIIKTHPHKHSEGNRKRWRNQVSEKERKRYEGVWAANRGLWISSSRTLSNSDRLSAIGSDSVLNLVVREIWSRSRLPPNALEQVWDLVDRHPDGTLAREEFVVGMWLIDQRLKGRKLPVKVSESIWESVRQISSANAPSLI